MTDLKERLKADAEHLRDIAKRPGTVVPGTQQKRVWIDPADANGMADRIEEKLNEDRQPTAFEREHPGYHAALSAANKANETEYDSHIGLT